MEEKTKGELLSEKLTYKPKSGYDKLSAEIIDSAFAFADGYKKFLDSAKTEREAATETVKILRKAGFTEFSPDKSYAAGQGIYIISDKKTVIAARVGKKSLGEGVNIVAAHIDSPRLDLKQHPLYESEGLALFKTHYYGGIKKYQWLTIPLALHGTVAKIDGSAVDISIGEDATDPVFTITDLLPHLAKDQYSKNLAEAVSGEGLNVLLGSRPYGDEKVKDKVKLNILSLLNEKYGITEADFLSAELTLVPAAKARDVGLDRSLIGAYGQDDRVCAYPPLIALAEDITTPDKTAVLILADKEEIGSEGKTSMQSHLFRNFIADLAHDKGVRLSDVWKNSSCLSADVNAAFDPNYGEVYEKANSAYLNRGVVLTKYTGSRGKSGSSDASAEFVAKIRGIFDTAGILWQTGELGKVDQGGGGTVAAYIANLNVDTVDLGVGILSMHAPFEISAKIDVYEMYRAAKAFWG
ncbi:M18 family aminopeptidase [Clostridia bacterium]|nr:M18 family aminopeptidase [Clostridia bacterium]